MLEVPISEALSSSLGWISIACGVIVFSPQIWENYSLQSGEGLSVAFVLIWLFGDACNLLGAIMASLQPTVIFIALYYMTCDFILFFQIHYYRHLESLHRRRLSELAQASHLEDSIESLQSTLARNEENERTALLAKRDEQLKASHWRYTKLAGYGASVIFVSVVGVVAFYVAMKEGRMGDGVGEGAGEKGGDIIEWKSQVLGYLSAFAYLFSRIPQIIKNRTTHCAGLSMALFVYSMAGNVTYVASILVKDMSTKHLIANASWILGSGGTVFLDLIVAGQFFYYADRRRQDALKSLSDDNDDQ